MCFVIVRKNLPSRGSYFFPPVKARGAHQEDFKIASASTPRDGDATCVEMV